MIDENINNEKIEECLKIFKKAMNDFDYIKQLNGIIRMKKDTRRFFIQKVNKVIKNLEEFKKKVKAIDVDE